METEAESRPTISQRGRALPCIDATGLGAWLEFVEFAIQRIAEVRYGHDGSADSWRDRMMFAEKTRAEFYRVFSMYAGYANPKRLSIDYAHDDGSFGILMTGYATVLVAVRPDGSVSGHS